MELLPTTSSVKPYNRRREFLGNAPILAGRPYQVVHGATHVVSYVLVLLRRGIVREDEMDWHIGEYEESGLAGEETLSVGV